MLAAVVFIATAVFAFGAVPAEVTVKVSDGDVSTARKGALYAALAESVMTIVRRHVTADQLSHKRGLRKYIANPHRFTIGIDRRRAANGDERSHSYGTAEPDDLLHRVAIGNQNAAR